MSEDANNAAGLGPHAKHVLSHAKLGGSYTYVQPGKDRKNKVKQCFGNSQIISSSFKEETSFWELPLSISPCMLVRLGTFWLSPLVCPKSVILLPWWMSLCCSDCCFLLEFPHCLCCEHVCAHACQSTKKLIDITMHFLLDSGVHVCLCTFVVDHVSSHSGNISAAQTGAEVGHAEACFVLSWDIFGLLCC